MRIILAGCILLVAAACGGGGGTAPSTPTAPAPQPAPIVGPAPLALQGVWESVLSTERGGPYPLQGAPVTLTLTENTYDIIVPIDRVIGTINVSGNLIQFSAPSSGCLGTATYQWTLNGRSLTFVRQGAEPCSGRNQVLNEVTFMKR